jgi:hypothetical protein
VGRNRTGSFRTDDVEATARELRAVGVTVSCPPEDRPYGTEAVFEVSGNEFGLLEPAEWGGAGRWGRAATAPVDAEVRPPGRGAEPWSAESGRSGRGPGHPLEGSVTTGLEELGHVAHGP